MELRLRGRVGQIVEPDELAGKWAFVIIVTDLTAEKVITEIGPLGDFETKTEALIALNGLARFISDDTSMLVDGTPSGKYLDMKSGGMVRHWDED